MSPRRPVTIVIPAYGRADEVTSCVRAALEGIDRRVDRIVVVNDLGPEADDVEQAMSAIAAAHPEVAHVRNERNLGFVGTCNRAAAELLPGGHDLLLLNSDTVPTPGFIDALVAGLDAHPGAGIATARSDNATIASLPLRRRTPQAPRSRGRTETVHRLLRDRLPTATIAPVAMGFCFYVRGDIVRAHGLFDEAFAPGYGEENDFCLRMAALGHLSVIAHGALVFHSGGASFGDRRQALRMAHERLLVERHPDYPAAVRRYLGAGIDAVDAFADVLVPPDSEPTILVDFDRIPFGRQRALLDEAADAPDVTVRVPAAGIRRIRRRHPGLALAADPSTSQVWDLIIGVGEPSPRQEARLGFAAPRVAEGRTLSRGWLVAARAEARTPLPADDQLRERWRRNGELVVRWDSLAPSRPSLVRRVARRVLGRR